MMAFAVRRVAAAALVLLVLAAVMLVLQKVSPVDPVRVKLGASASPNLVERERDRLGYNDALPAQYAQYIGDLAEGDLQTSLRTGQPVATDLGDLLPASLELIAAVVVIATVLAVLLGVATAIPRRGSGSLRVLLVAGAAVPPFLLALLGILLFYRGLGWLPATGRSSIVNSPDGPTGFLIVDGILAGRPAVVGDALEHLIMPALCIALLPAVSVGRVLRGSVMASLRSDQVRTARAKGLTTNRIILAHCLRNAAGPTLAMAGLMVGVIFASLVVVEVIFAWPGIGFYTAQSIPKGDFPAIAGVTLLMGATYVLVNTAVDLLQAAADPRLRTN